MSNTYQEILTSQLKDRSAKVAILGLGYVGLPLILRFCEVGFPVLGFDTDAHKVELLNRRESYIKHIPAALISELGQPRQGKGQFSATSDMTRLAEPDVLIICMPTPLTSQREPDLRYVENTGRQIA